MSPKKISMKKRPETVPLWPGERKRQKRPRRKQEKERKKSKCARDRALVGDLLRVYGGPSHHLVTLPVRRLTRIDPKKIRKALELSHQQFSTIFGLSMATIRRAEMPGAKLNRTVQLVYHWINYDPAQLAELHGYSLRWYAEHGLADRWFKKLNHPSSGMYQLTRAYGRRG